MKTLLTTLICVFLTPLHAQSFTFEHRDCQIRVKEEGSDKEMTHLLSLAKNLLEQRNYNVLPFMDNKRVLPGELYFTLKVTRSKESIYKPCFVSFDVKLSTGNLPKEADKKLFSKEIKRSLPRITFSGSERCRMALEDSFIHVPTCVAQN